MRRVFAKTRLKLESCREKSKMTAHFDVWGKRSTGKALLGKNGERIRDRAEQNDQVVESDSRETWDTLEVRSVSRRTFMTHWFNRDGCMIMSQFSWLSGALEVTVSVAFNFHEDTDCWLDDQVSFALVSVLSMVQGWIDVVVMVHHDLEVIYYGHGSRVKITEMSWGKRWETKHQHNSNRRRAKWEQG